MSEKVDVVIVGAGLAGLGTAYHLAASGVETLVVERGDYPGSKNVSGGRLYLKPLRPFYQDLFGENIDQVPFERAVVKEQIIIMADAGSTSIGLHAADFNAGSPHSVTVLRGVFDRWLGDKAAEKGAMIVPGYKVDDLIWEDHRITGIVSAGDEIRADIVVAADGALSFIAERAGLRKQHSPNHFALAMKEVIELPEEHIETRFGLSHGEGSAILMFGALTKGMSGGGFLYTNRQSLSLGMVVDLGSALETGTASQILDFMDLLKARPEVAPLIAGGDTVEYSAHVIPEAAHLAMPSLVRDGLLVTGDAAGLVLNMGITMRGMDFALASGAIAAMTILEAKAEGNFSSRSLSRYERALRESFVMQDLQTFAKYHNFLNIPRLYQLYPQWIFELMEALYRIDDGPKKSLWKTAFHKLKELPTRTALGDLLKIRRL